METPRIEDAPDSVSETLADSVTEETSEASDVDPDGMALRAGESGPDFLALGEDGDVVEPEVVATNDTPPAEKSPLSEAAPSDSPWTGTSPVSSGASSFSWNPGAPVSDASSDLASDSEPGEDSASDWSSDESPSPEAEPATTDEAKDDGGNSPLIGEEPEIVNEEVKGVLEAFFQADPSLLAESVPSEEAADHDQAEEAVIGEAPVLEDQDAGSDADADAEASTDDTPAFAWMSAGMDETDADSDSDSEIGLKNELDVDGDSPWASAEKAEPVSASEEEVPTESVPTDVVSSIIDIACPECGKGLSLKREHLGIAGHCVWCEAPIVASESVTEQLVRVFLLKPGSGATAVSIPVAEVSPPTNREGDAEAEGKADLKTEIDLEAEEVSSEAETVVTAEVAADPEIGSETRIDDETAEESPIAMGDSTSSERDESEEVSAWAPETSWTPPAQGASLVEEATEPSLDAASTAIDVDDAASEEAELSQVSLVSQEENSPEGAEDETATDLESGSSDFSWMPPEIGAEAGSEPELEAAVEAEATPEANPEWMPASAPEDEEQSATESDADPFATAARITGSEESEKWQLPDPKSDETPAESTFSTGSLPSSFSLGAESPAPSFATSGDVAEVKDESEGGSEDIDSLSSLIERSQTGGPSGGLFAAPLSTGIGAEAKGALDADDLLVEPDGNDSEVAEASETDAALSEVSEEAPDKSIEVGSATIRKSLFESSAPEAAGEDTEKDHFEDKATAAVSGEGDDLTETGAADAEADSEPETEESLLASSIDATPKKKRKSRAVTLVILLLMVLGLAAGGAAAFLFREQIQSSLLSRFSSPPPELMGEEGESPDLAPESTPADENEGPTSEEPVTSPASAQSSETLDSSHLQVAGGTPSSDDLPTSVAPSRPEPQLIPENRSLFGGGSLQINDGSGDSESPE